MFELSARAQDYLNRTKSLLLMKLNLSRLISGIRCMN